MAFLICYNTLIRSGDIMLEKLYIARKNILGDYGLRKGLIKPFSKSFYDKLNEHYYDGLPISFHIKYLRPKTNPGLCFERSLYMLMCFNDAVLVKADIKDLKLTYGKKFAKHCWIEIDDWVYDPTLLLKFKKKLYYKMFLPKNIKKRTIEDYKDNKYSIIMRTKIDDLKPNGKNRCDIGKVIPSIVGRSFLEEDYLLMDDLKDYLDVIEYNTQDMIKGIISELKKKKSY